MSNTLFKTDSEWEKFINDILALDDLDEFDVEPNFKSIDVYVHKLIDESENGDTESMFELATFLRMTENYELGNAYYKKAADLGLVEAQFNYGVSMESDGNFSEAEKYFRMAIEQDFEEAKENLAELLEKIGKTE